MLSILFQFSYCFFYNRNATLFFLLPIQKKTESISCQRYVSVFFVYEDSTLLRAVYFYMRRMYTASAYSCSNSVTCNSNCRFIIYYINYIYKPPWGFIFKKFYLIKLSIPFFNFPSPSLS